MAASLSAFSACEIRSVSGIFQTLKLIARIVNVSDCTPNEFFNFFSLDDTQAQDIVSDSLRLRDINTQLYSFSDPFFLLIMSPMFQALPALQTGCPLSRLRLVINSGSCTPNCFLPQSCLHSYCPCLDGHSCQRSRSKESKLARNNQLTNHSLLAMLVMAARDLTNQDRMRSKWVAGESRDLLELLLLSLLDTEL
jgi:hypothetical protein